MKLVVALDTEIKKSKRLIEQLSDSVQYYKIGHRLFIENPEILGFMAQKNKKVFLDMKYHDIPSVVGLAVKAVSRKYNIFAITMHSSGGRAMLQEAVKARNELPESKRPLLFGVTVLTSLNSEDLKEIYSASDLNEKVKNLALLAQESGVDGIVCSGKEVELVKKTCGDKFLTLVPGVSIGNEVQRKDQKRVVAIEEIAKYIDYAVVGRQITESVEPASVAKKISQIAM